MNNFNDNKLNYKKVLFDYFKYNKLDNSEIEMLNDFYREYLNINELADGDYLNNKDVLNKLEDEIYTVASIKLTEVQRIWLEIEAIFQTLNKSSFGISDDDRAKIVKKIDSIIELLKTEELDDKLIEYIKQQIAILEITLRMKPKFLFATCTAFQSLCGDIYIKNCTKKKELK